MSDLSKRAQEERLTHLASNVVDSARKRHGAAMAVGSALEDLTSCLNHPSGSWTNGEASAVARIRQKLEEALELLQP